MQYAGIDMQTIKLIKDAIWHLEDYYEDFMMLLTETAIPS
jgi:hypothetical protein